MHYLSLVFRDDGEGYGFTIPDIPGFTAHAENASLDEALAMARRILADHIAAMVDQGLAVPAARPPEEVLGDPEVQEDLGGSVAQLLLPAIFPAGRTLRINITIDEATLALADRAARDRGLTRSAFIAEACRRFAAEADMSADFVERMERIAREHEELLQSAAGTGAAERRGRKVFAPPKRAA